MELRLDRKHGVMLDAPVEEVRCRECDGRCCRSFVSVAISCQEYDRLRALGAQRLEDWAGRCWLIIEHGCEFLVTGKCSIYRDRPEQCRRFTCTEQ